MAKKKKSGEATALWLGIFGAATLSAALYFLFVRNKIDNILSGVYGGTCNGCVQGMPESKQRAHRWLEAQMDYQGEDPIVHQTVDEASGLELGQAGELARVLHREYGQSVTHEHVPWDGIGRPEW